jgi:hypothetical protein
VRACRIKKQIHIGNYRDESQRLKTQGAMIDAMIRLERALKPQIKVLKI